MGCMKPSVSVNLGFGGRFLLQRYLEIVILVRWEAFSPNTADLDIVSVYAHI